MTSIVLRRLSTEMDGFLVNGLRCTLALLVVLPLVWLTGGFTQYHQLDWRQLFFLMGSVAIGGAVGDGLYVLSLKTLGISRAFPITNSYPVFTVLFSALFLGEQITLSMVAGMALVLAGVFMITRSQPTESLDTLYLSRDQLIKGVAIALATAIIWAMATVLLAAGLTTKLNVFVVSSIRVPVVIGLSLIFCSRRRTLRQAVHLPRRTWGLLFVAGVLGWAIGGSLYTAAIQHAGPAKTSIIGAMSPLFALPLSYFFLHERPTRLVLLGTAISVAGIFLVL